MSKTTSQNSPVAQTDKALTQSKRAVRKAPASRRAASRKSATAPSAASAPEISAFQDLPVAAVVFDADNKLLVANTLYLEAFGRKAADMLPGTPVEDIISLSIDEDLFSDEADVPFLLDTIKALRPGEIDTSTLTLQGGRKIGQSLRKLQSGGWVATYSDISVVTQAEAQAREAENRWNFALESARQGVWDSNLATGEVFYSHMWRVIRGLEDCDESSLTGEAWKERLHPDDRDAVIDAIHRQDDGEILSKGIHYRERHSNGEWIWILSRGQAIAWDQNGKPSRIIGTDTDITETRNAQAALAESEARWDFALKGTGQGVWDADITNNKVYYSPIWRQMRGFGPDEDIPSDQDSWLDRLHPDDRDRIREAIRKQDAGQIPKNDFEYRERHRDGHYVWIKSRGEPVAWDESGRPTRVIGVDTDITVTKELELKVRESLQVLNTTLNSFPGGICMYDGDLVLLVANRGYYEINRIDEHWFPVGSKLEDILRHHAENGDYGDVDIESFVAERMEESRQFSPAKFQITRADGSATIEYSRTPLEGGGFVMTFEDITERLSAEQEKSLLEKELIQAQRLESLGTLASGIAHEINTPIQYVGDNIRFIAQSLRDVLAILQLCRRSMRSPIDPGLIAENAEAVHALETQLDLAFILEELPLALEQSAQGVKQVATIVRAIKEFSHPGQEEMTEFDINALIETTLIVSKNQWKYVAEVETDLDRSLPIVPCLPGEIGQALLNIVVNAAHAIEAAQRENGLIRVATHLEGEAVVVEISDNGTGIPDAIRARIYDPFFTTKDIGKGTGQGLSIAFNAVVNKHGGTLDCSSREGEGTTFRLTLPVAEPHQEQSEEAA